MHLSSSNLLASPTPSLPCCPELLAWPFCSVPVSQALLLMPLVPGSLPQTAEAWWALASTCWQLAHTLSRGRKAAFTDEGTESQI